MKGTLCLRCYCPEDANELARLFRETIFTVNAADYTQEQLQVWAAGADDLVRWKTSFSEHITVIALVEHQIAGFGDIDESGYLDRLYVHRDFQRMGIGTALAERLESAVRSANLVCKIVTHASVTARPFFEGRGYQTIKEQLVERKGILLKNFVMEKIFSESEGYIN